ncbi:MAG TPA: hypothetical protein VFX45_02875 [Solirubrobacterales bacterium]|nr:hypothetical protein [Solirubrobacterales bacterium]
MSDEALALQAGAVGLEVEGPDLRGLELGGRVLVQRIYPAFRDADWGTAPLQVRHRQVETGERSFSLAMEGSATLGELDLEWSLRAEGGEDGALVCAVEAKANRPVEYRRLGICLHLDAAACVGARAVAKGPDGAEECRLGDPIAPQLTEGERYLPMLGPFDSLALSFPGGAGIGLAGEGATFELEDQRNWADSSLKVYSSGAPGLSRLGAGETVRQGLRLRFAVPPQRAARPRADELEVGKPSAAQVPPFGLAVSAGWSAPSGIRPAHLRLDVGLGDEEVPGGPETERLLADTGAAVELAVHGAAGDPATLPEICAGLPLARVLALDRSERSTSFQLRQLVATALGRDAPFAVGTSAHFSEVCRRPPEAAGAAFLAWSAHPQAHAGDDRSVIENLPGLGAQVRTARALLPDLSPIVSTLRLAPAGASDPRGASAFGAAWAVGAFAQLLGAGVGAVTVAGEAGEGSVAATAAVLMAALGAPLRPVSVVPGTAAVAWGKAEAVMLVANLSPARRSVTVRHPGVDPVELHLGSYQVERLTLPGA